MISECILRFVITCTLPRLGSLSDGRQDSNEGFERELGARFIVKC